MVNKARYQAVFTGLPWCNIPQISLCAIIFCKAMLKKKGLVWRGWASDKQDKKAGVFLLVNQIDEIDQTDETDETDEINVSCEF